MEKGRRGARKEEEGKGENGKNNYDKNRRKKLKYKSIIKKYTS